MADPSGSDESAEQTPPPRDPAALARVIQRVEIRTVALVSASLETQDLGPVPPAGAAAAAAPDLGIAVEDWGLSAARDEFGVLIAFTADFDDVDAPYRLLGRFRLTYQLEPGDPLDSADVEQFVYWNSVFNAWPYWREFLGSTLDRAALPRITVPAMRLPSDER